MKKLLLILLLAPMLHGAAFAEGLAERGSAEWGTAGVRDALPEELQEIGGELSFSGDYDGAGALERLWTSFLNRVGGNLRNEARGAISLLAVCLLCAVSVTLCTGQKQGDYIQYAGCAAAALLLTGDMNSLVAEAFSTLKQMSDYAKAALPAIFTTAAAGGAIASASARYAACCLGLDLMLVAAEKLICPLVGAALAMAVCGSIWDNPMLRSGLKLSKRLAGLLMSAMTAGFTALISLTGLVSGSADAAAVKATKSLLSAALPVVGKIMADAASAVVSAAAVVRNTAGAFGIVGVCALCLAPFARLLVKRWLLILISAAAEMTACDRLARLLGEMSSLMGILLGLVGSYGMILFFSIVSALRTVTG